MRGTARSASCLIVQGSGKGRARFREKLPRLLAPAPIRELPEHADRKVQFPLRIEYRRAGDDRPALLALPVDAKADDGAGALALQRKPARQLVVRKGFAVLSEDFEPAEDPLARRREQRFGGVEPAQPRSRIVGEDQLTFRCLDRDAFGDAAEDQVELIARAAHVAFVELRLPPSGLLCRGEARRFVRLPARGEVTRDLRESSERATTIAERGDDDRRPEAATVLAHAPALFFEPAVGADEREDGFGLAGGAVLSGEEHRVWLADDFIGRVTLDSLRTGVPGRGPTLLVDHEDGVVDDLLDQEPEQIDCFFVHSIA
jgi:hypothetical protein